MFTAIKNLLCSIFFQIDIIKMYKSGKLFNSLGESICALNMNL